MPVFQDKEEQEDGLMHFSLPGLLPDGQTLVVNPAMRTAILLAHEASNGASVLAQHVFSPNGMRVLVPLLQAYPDYCPYEVLLSTLFPLSIDQCRKLLREAWDLSVRPVRRAIANIVVGFHSFGLKVYSLRGLGYILRPV